MACFCCSVRVMSELVQLVSSGAIVTLTLNDPDKRNALGTAMFDALEAQLREAERIEGAHVLLVRGNGKAFCAGFDLRAAVETPAVLEAFVMRLSGVCRTLRRAPMVVVAAVQGAALAGGCAIVSACDLVIAAPSAKFGYPVHALGISPAVTIPTLMPRVGDGAARSLLMGGEIITAGQAESIGLVSRVASSDESLADEALALCQTLAGHGAGALRATKAWINELDGSLDDSRFDGPARSSATAAVTPAAAAMLRAAWAKRSAASRG